MTRSLAQTAVKVDAWKEAPLLDDIRLLGQILGDTIREQQGVENFDRIETIRRLSVAFERDADLEAGQRLDALLRGLSTEEAILVARAFSYFSHLANIAEDRHYIRRREAHEQRDEADDQPGSLAATFRVLGDAGISATDIAGALDRSLVSPVLTAHPTEVRRKSLLDAEGAIAHLLAVRENLKTKRERLQNDAHLKARVVQMWQTRLLRVSRLTVWDEIENALSYYQTTFLREIPRLYAELEERLEGLRIGPFFRMGSWIGGDRDGNPNVDAQTLRGALRRQCDTALRHYLTEIHELGAELSISRTLVGCARELDTLADRSGNEDPHRADQPYRRALIGIYARLAGTLAKLTGTPALRHAAASAEPYDRAEDLQSDLATIEESLRSHHGESLVPARLAPLRRAVDVFGFHLATVDL